MLGVVWEGRWKACGVGSHYRVREEMKETEVQSIDYLMSRTEEPDGYLVLLNWRGQVKSSVGKPYLVWWPVYMASTIRKKVATSCCYYVGCMSQRRSRIRQLCFCFEVCLHSHDLFSRSAPHKTYSSLLPHMGFVPKTPVDASKQEGIKTDKYEYSFYRHKPLVPCTVCVRYSKRYSCND